MDEKRVGRRSEHAFSPGENGPSAPELAPAENTELKPTATKGGSIRFPRPQLLEVYRSRLRGSTQQIRRDHIDLSELKMSLRNDGQLCPLFTVRTGELIDGGEEIYEILDGHRRFAASDGILEMLRCFVFEPGIKPEDLLAFQLVVNVNCANLSQADQARAIYELFKWSGAATINEFVESDHGLSFGAVWVRNLVILGQASRTDASDIERSIFDRVQQGKLSVKKAAEELVNAKESVGEGKSRRGRPKRGGHAGKPTSKNESLVEVFVARSFRLSLKSFEQDNEAFGDWELALIRKKKSRELPPVPAGIVRAAQEILALASKEFPGEGNSPA